MEKYRPKRVEEMVGNEYARLRLVSWLREWKVGDKPALLVGPPGTGKTTLIHLAAQACGANLIELNASDVRTKDRLEKVIGEALSTTTLFESRSLVFLDEVDGLAGRMDYGGFEFIREATKTSKNPIAMAANNPDADHVKKLASISMVILLRPPPPREMEIFLRYILEKEGMKSKEGALSELVTNAQGDLRHAIHLLQSGSTNPSFDEKNTQKLVSESFNSFFEAKDVSQALNAMRESQLPPNEKLREMFRCVVKSKLPPQKMRRALEVISRADILLGRIRSGKEWRILRYLDGILANDLWSIIQGEGLSYSEGDLPWNMLLRVWNDSKKVRELSSRYSTACHTSARSARVQDVPYLLFMAKSKEFKRKILSVLDLDETFDKFLDKEAGVLR